MRLMEAGIGHGAILAGIAGAGLLALWGILRRPWQGGRRPPARAPAGFAVLNVRGLGLMSGDTHRENGRPDEFGSTRPGTDTGDQ